MDLGVISVRYARALLKSATEQKCEQKVYQEMQSLGAAYIQVPQLRAAIDNPMLDKENKFKLLKTAAGGDVSDLTDRFIRFVLEGDREKDIQFMAAAYITLYRKQKNITRGKLITAAPVSPDTEKKMKQMVESRTQGTVEFQTEIDPEIIGGFILEYDTYRMDASVQSQLRNILTQLKK